MSCDSKRENAEKMNPEMLCHPKKENLMSGCSEKKNPSEKSGRPGKENVISCYSRKMNSPVGMLTLVASESALRAVLWEKDDSPRDASAARMSPASPNNKVLVAAETQLREYFAGKRKSFDLPLEMHGTDFQKRVWHELTRIPFGTTATYAEIAARVGKPKACRAVGAANRSNPISIIVPCHRVVGVGGALTGFGGGIKAKAYLLEHEARVARAAEGSASKASGASCPSCPI